MLIKATETEMILKMILNNGFFCLIFFILTFFNKSMLFEMQVFPSFRLYFFTFVHSLLYPIMFLLNFEKFLLISSGCVRKYHSGTLFLPSLCIRKRFRRLFKLSRAIEREMHPKTEKRVSTQAIFSNAALNYKILMNKVNVKVKHHLFWD